MSGHHVQHATCAIIPIGIISKISLSIFQTSFPLSCLWWKRQWSRYWSVACRGLVIPGATAWLDAPLPNYGIEQWRMVVIVTGYTLFVTSQYDVIFTFANQRFGEICWHNMHVQGRQSSGRAGSSPIATWGFWGFISPNKTPSPLNWIM